MAEPVSEAFYAAVLFAGATGSPPLNTLPGCFEAQVDDHWWIAINAHAHEMACSRGADVPPYHVYVERDDWPAGLIGPSGGLLARVGKSVEDDFIAALDAAKARVAHA